MVVSTSTYQWLNPLEPAFAEAWRVLKPGGRFCFALFGEKTLFELRESYNYAVSLQGLKAADRTHRFLGCTDVGRALESVGFSEIDVFEEMEVENYPDVTSLLRSVNGIGAGNAAGPSSAGLGGRGLMLKMMEIYTTRYGDKTGIPATYEVLYGSGQKISLNES
jgi:malonyl-CoA O-methyltransferase